MAILLGLTAGVSLARQNKESEIRKLENMEGEAWIKKDSSMLFKLFSSELVVNSPRNKAINLDILKKLVRAGKVDISSGEKKIEKVSFIRDMAIVMGSDMKCESYLQKDQYK